MSRICLPLFEEAKKYGDYRLYIIFNSTTYTQNTEEGESRILMKWKWKQHKKEVADKLNISPRQLNKLFKKMLDNKLIIEDNEKYTIPLKRINKDFKQQYTLIDRDVGKYLLNAYNVNSRVILTYAILSNIESIESYKQQFKKNKNDYYLLNLKTLATLVGTNPNNASRDYIGEEDNYESGGCLTLLKLHELIELYKGEQIVKNITINQWAFKFRN